MLTAIDAFLNWKVYDVATDADVPGRAGSTAVLQAQYNSAQVGTRYIARDTGNRYTKTNTVLYAAGGRVTPETTAGTQFLAGDGSALAPAYSFTNDPDTGIYREAANTLSFAIGGATAYRFNITQMLTPDGTSAAPGHAFINAPALGIYNAGANTLGFAGGGASFGTLSAAALALPTQYMQMTEIVAPAGSANTVRLYAVDNAGKTELRAIFGSGASQLVAAEP